MGKKRLKVQTKSEFRKLHTKEEKGHLHYVAGRKGNKYQSIGITHGKRTRGEINIPLEQNPNPNDTRKAYARPKLTERNAKDFGPKQENFRFSTIDKKTIDELLKSLSEGQGKSKK